MELTPTVLFYYSLLPGIINGLITYLWIPYFLKKHPRASIYVFESGLRKFSFTLTGFFPLVGYAFILIITASNIYDMYYFLTDEE
jgi:hypothetical protein